MEITRIHSMGTTTPSPLQTLHLPATTPNQPKQTGKTMLNKINEFTGTAADIAIIILVIMWLIEYI